MIKLWFDNVTQMWERIYIINLIAIVKYSPAMSSSLVRWLDCDALHCQSLRGLWEIKGYNMSLKELG